MRTRCARLVKRIGALICALLVAVQALGVPRAKAVTGVDDVTTGIMAVLVHLKSVGTEIAVTQGTSLATQNAVTSLATQAGAAGAFGAGVTGASALATIGASVVAFAGGFQIGYAGYQTLSELVAWLRESYLTGTAPNKVYSHGGSYETLLDGSDVVQGRDTVYTFGDVYQTQAGSSWTLTKQRTDDDTAWDLTLTTISSDNIVKTFRDTFKRAVYDDYGIFWADYGYCVVHLSSNWSAAFGEPGSTDMDKVFGESSAGGEEEREEVVLTPPVDWVLPAPTPDQVVEYRPYPDDPDKTIQDIIADVPESIYDGTLSPSAPTVTDPTTDPPVDPDPPPTDPDIPTINPNPPASDETPDDVKPATVALGMIFPFCIPFDVYHMVTLLVAEPEAPNGRWEFALPWAPGTQYVVEWDLEDYNDVAALLRTMELILFAVGLAALTRRYIKW